MTHEEFQIIRKELGLTQVELAKKLGCRSNTISRIETGKAPLVDAKAQALANLLTIQVLRQE